MKNRIGKSGIVLIFLSAILLSACAGASADEQLTGALSKPISDLGFLGTVDGITDVAWTVDGRTIKLSDDTKFESELRIGDTVRVEVKLGDDGFLSALAIESSSLDLFVVGSEVEFYGVVEEITTTTWLIGSFEVEVTSGTEIKPGIELGDLVKVHANFSDSGSLVAREIELADEDEADDDMDRFEIEFYGVVEEITDELWTIEGFELVINPWTEIKGLIQVGDLVKVHATFGDGDTLIAREIELPGEDEPDHDDRDEIEFYGVVETISDSSWVIAGREVMVTPQTEIKNLIEVGDLVKVHAFLGEGDMLIAREIELADADDDDEDHDSDEVEFVGMVEAISDTEWTINGLLVQVNSETEIEDEISVGDMVEVEAYEDQDGNLIAHEIELADDDDLDSDFDDDDDLYDEDDDDDDDDHDEDDHDEDDYDDDEDDEYDDHDERDGDGD